ncbi:MAG TPA: cytochrome P450 [Streptosporangiaceae bacterium]|nr:cytochrome P450 [Streptosporangiaceae bacterium]
MTAEPLLDPDPYPYYEQLRTHHPVQRMNGTGFYVLTRYEDLRAVLRDPETFSNTLDLEELSGEKARQLGARYQQRLKEKGWPHVPTLHQSDPPEHTRYRRLLNKVFSPTRVRQMVPDVQRICDQLIDAFAGAGHAEFVQEFAFPLPAIVISEQLGLSSQEIGTFRRWADAMLAPAQGLLTDEEATLRYADIEAEAQHYLAGVFEARRQNPTGDLISALVAASQEEEQAGGRPLSMPELQNLLQQLITGGYITTADAITSAMWLLTQHPEQIPQIKNDPKTFAEESLRMLAPVQGLFRKATRDVELHGVNIPEGAILHVRYGAANRDPGTFRAPDTFDVAREHVMRHMSFGQGPHACVGAPLARQELVTAFERLLARLDDFRLDPDHEPERNPGLLFYSFKTLPIRFGPGGPERQ